MDAIFEAGLDAIRWLQASYPQLTNFFVFITSLGAFELYLAVVPAIYWSVNKKFGKYLLYLLVWAVFSSNTLKHLFQQPRPFWMEPSLGIVESSGYGLPSGHATGATVVYGFIASWFKRSWVWLVAIVMIFLMGISRVFLGVHFVHDVLLGYLLGGMVLGVYWGFRRYFQDRFRNQILGRRLLAVLAVPAGIVVVYIIVRLLIGAPDTSVAWGDYQEAAEMVGLDNVVTAIGALIGMGAGFMLEASRVHFKVEGVWWKRVARVIVGLIGIAILWLGLGAVLPDEPLWLALPLVLVRDFLVGLWLTYYAPATFVRLGLAESTPEPEVSLSVSDKGLMQG